MTPAQVGQLFDTMLDQLEAMNITDSNFLAFNKTWTDFCKQVLKFDRAAQNNTTRPAVNAFDTDDLEDGE